MCSEGYIIVIITLCCVSVTMIHIQTKELGGVIIMRRSGIRHNVGKLCLRLDQGQYTPTIISYIFVSLVFLYMYLAFPTCGI